MNRFSLYSPLKTWKKGEYPVAPFVYLAVGTYSQSDGEIIISSQLMNNKEIDETVDQLIKELKEFQIKLKKELELLANKMVKK